MVLVAVALVGVMHVARLIAVVFMAVALVIAVPMVVVLVAIALVGVMHVARGVAVVLMAVALVLAMAMVGSTGPAAG